MLALDVFEPDRDVETTVGRGMVGGSATRNCGELVSENGTENSHYNGLGFGRPLSESVSDCPVQIVPLPRDIRICIARFHFVWECEGWGALVVEHGRWWLEVKR